MVLRTHVWVWWKDTGLVVKFTVQLVKPKSHDLALGIGHELVGLTRIDPGQFKII